MSLKIAMIGAGDIGFTRKRIEGEYYAPTPLA